MSLIIRALYGLGRTEANHGHHEIELEKNRVKLKLDLNLWTELE